MLTSEEGRNQSDELAPKTLVRDNHNHIILSDIESMVGSAKSKRIECFSITEHISQFRRPRETIKFGSVHSTGRMFESLKEYRGEFSRVGQDEASSILVRKGLEVDFSSKYESKVGDYVNQEEWDVLLCSVHELEDGTDVQRRVNGLSREEAHKRWREYMKSESIALESDFIPFNVLTHPVRMAQGNVHFPEDEIDSLLLDLARRAKKRKKALELNGSDLEFSPDLVKRLAIACSKAGCPVSLGSDAHHPNEVFRKMNSAMKLVEEYKLEVL